jgi:hypothetical protein
MRKQGTDENRDKTTRHCESVVVLVFTRCKASQPVFIGGIIREEMNMNDAAEAELDCALRIPAIVRGPSYERVHPGLERCGDNS